MISDDCTHGITKTRAAIRKPMKLGLIGQDTRSIRAGHEITNPASLFSTCSENKERVNLVRYDIVWYMSEGRDPEGFQLSKPGGTRGRITVSDSTCALLM